MTEKFRTEVKIQSDLFPKMNHKRPVALIGSCFSDNIGKKLNDFRFENFSNPFGVTYNPVSIASQLKRIINDDEFSTDDLFEKDGMWNNFELHGSFLSVKPQDLLDKVNSDLVMSKNLLKRASHLFLTFGTSWVYELKESGQIVNNCHKIPSKLFDKRILTIEEIIEVYSELIPLLIDFNPDLQIVLTLSPVRHLKDGFEQNTISKSTLRIAIQGILELQNTTYFPSYEIMMDDLRDYRFFENDLIHPNPTAIDYIWRKMSSAFFIEKDMKLLEEIESLNKALSHKAFNPESEQHQKFIQRTLNQIEALSNKLPGLSFEKDKTNLLSGKAHHNN